MRYLSITLVVMILAITGCNHTTPEESHDMAAIQEIKISDATWKKLAGKKIFFGHQSVGFNIIDGIKDLMQASPVDYRLNIIELSGHKNLDAPGFYHARVGSNVDPVSKIDDFARQMDAGLGNTVDIAFFKFCFVDIGPDTDIEKVFKHYQETMARLEKQYPNTRFVHFTVPLATTMTSWKTKLKVLLKKKEIWEFDGNIRKNQYNDLIRSFYADREPIFDIARYESLYPSGTRSGFTMNGKKYFDLAPEYTYDDGHLNEKGRIWVASHLLDFLARL